MIHTWVVLGHLSFLICNTFHLLLQLKTALNGIVPLVDELREKKMLPAICFNDDRTACEQLAEA